MLRATPFQKPAGSALFAVRLLRRALALAGFLGRENHVFGLAAFGADARRFTGRRVRDDGQIALEGVGLELREQFVADGRTFGASRFSEPIERELTLEAVDVVGMRGRYGCRAKNQAGTGDPASSVMQCLRHGRCPSGARGVWDAFVILRDRSRTTRGGSWLALGEILSLRPATLLRRAVSSLSLPTPLRGAGRKRRSIEQAALVRSARPTKNQPAFKSDAVGQREALAARALAHRARATPATASLLKAVSIALL